jgi:hypothetical protein
MPPDGYATYGGAHSLDGNLVQARAAAGLPSEGSSPNGVQQDPASMISDSRTSHGVAGDYNGLLVGERHARRKPAARG